MELHTKRYFWSTMAGAVVYVLGVILMKFQFHSTTGFEDFVTVFVFPLCPAAWVSAFINLKCMLPQRRKYFWRMTACTVAYVLGIDVANHLYAPHSLYRYWLILLPVLPLIYMASTIIRFIADADEMWRKIYMEALAFSAIATGFTSFSYLFVRDLGAPQFHPEWAFYLMWIYYGIGMFFSARRYR